MRGRPTWPAARAPPAWTWRRRPTRLRSERRSTARGAPARRAWWMPTSAGSLRRMKRLALAAVLLLALVLPVVAADHPLLVTPAWLPERLGRADVRVVDLSDAED